MVEVVRESLMTRNKAIRLQFLLEKESWSTDPNETEMAKLGVTVFTSKAIA